MSNFSIIFKKKMNWLFIRRHVKVVDIILAS